MDLLDEFKTTDKETGNSNDFFNDKSSGGSSGNYSSSGTNNNNSGGMNNALAEWQRKQKEVQPLYLPLIIYIEYDFPDEVKNKLVEFAIKLMGAGFTVRFNGEDFAIYDKLTEVGGAKAEGHLPFSPFKDMKTDSERSNKWSRNNATMEDLARRNFGNGWDKIKNFFRILMTRNARMLIGHRMDSPAKAMITWSPDGASHGFEVSNETGRVGTYIKMASSVAVPVFNINSQESRKLLNDLILKGVVNEQ